MIKNDLERLKKHYRCELEWAWIPDKKVKCLDLTPVLWSENIGSMFAIKIKRRWVAYRLPCSDLSKHTCTICGRRGRKGNIHLSHIPQLQTDKLTCFGCREKLNRLYKQELVLEKLAIDTRRHLRNIKGIANESTKNHA